MLTFWPRCFMYIILQLHLHWRLKIILTFILSCSLWLLHNQSTLWPLFSMVFTMELQTLHTQLILWCVSMNFSVTLSFPPDPVYESERMSTDMWDFFVNLIWVESSISEAKQTRRVYLYLEFSVKTQWKVTTEKVKDARKGCLCSPQKQNLNTVAKILRILKSWLI